MPTPTLTPGDTPHPDVRLIGGEMLLWSDLGSVDEVFDSSLALSLWDSSTLAGKRVLLLGPHSLTFCSTLAERAGELHVLVRSYPDVLTHRDHIDDEAQVTWWCGAAQRLWAREDVPCFDLIVALDGLRRLEGPDLEPVGWHDVLAGVRSMLAPGGRLLMAVDNRLGVHRVVAPPGHERADGRWPTTASPEDAPLGLPSLLGSFDSLGLRSTETWAAFPNSSTPTLFVTHRVLEEQGNDDHLIALVSRAFLHERRQHDHLKDPRSLASHAVRAGLGLAMAPTWVFDLHEDAEPARRKKVLVAEASVREFWAARYSIETHSRAQGWQRDLLTDGDPTRRAGHVVRRLDLLAGDMPDGELLENRLLDLCHRHDLVGLRTELRAWYGWLSSHAQPSVWTSPWNGQASEQRVLPSRLAFASPDNVVLDNGDYRLVDPSWALDFDVPLDVAAVRALRAFGEDLAGGGHAHPWPHGSTPERIARSLAVMIGLVVNDELAIHASALASSVDEPPSPFVAADPDVAREHAERRSARPLGYPRFISVAEAEATVHRLADEISAKDQQIEWLVRHIHARERALRKRRKAVRDLRRQLKVVEERLAAPGGARRPRIRNGASDPAEATDTSAPHTWRPPTEREKLDPDLLPPGYRSPGSP